MTVKNSQKRILIAPLDWGLGHTSRCIPLVRFLLAAGHYVVVAGTPVQRMLFRAACPGVDEAPLDGYNITYSRKWLLAGLATQLPKMAMAFNREKKWLAAFVPANKIDGVISDSRYGLHSAGVPCVILTHQLSIQSNLGRVADNLVQQRHYKMLRPFDNVWVVDDAAAALAGLLSHPERFPEHAVYAGLLSQCVPQPTQHLQQLRKEQHLLVLLSGPEPQRTLLSNSLWSEVQQHSGPVVFVEGSTGIKRTSPPHILHYDMVDAGNVSLLMDQASLVICRSGYTSLMDLTRLGAKAVLIPTPGQTEQEYLAKHAQQKGWFLSALQEGFSLDAALAQASGFPFLPAAPTAAFHVYEPLLDHWAASL